MKSTTSLLTYKQLHLIRSLRWCRIISVPERWVIILHSVFQKWGFLFFGLLSSSICSAVTFLCSVHFYSRCSPAVSGVILRFEVSVLAATLFWFEEEAYPFFALSLLFHLLLPCIHRLFVYPWIAFWSRVSFIILSRLRLRLPWTTPFYLTQVNEGVSCSHQKSFLSSNLTAESG